MTNAAMKMFVRRSAALTMKRHLVAAARGAATGIRVLCQGLLAALDESRAREAARMIARYRHLAIDDDSTRHLEPEESPKNPGVAQHRRAGLRLVKRADV